MENNGSCAILISLTLLFVQLFPPYSHTVFCRTFIPSRHHNQLWHQFPGLNLKGRPVCCYLINLIQFCESDRCDVFLNTSLHLQFCQICDPYLLTFLCPTFESNFGVRVEVVQSIPMVEISYLFFIFLLHFLYVFVL